MAAPLTPLHGTPVFRGTLVGNHWCRECLLYAICEKKSYVKKGKIIRDLINPTVRSITLETALMSRLRPESIRQISKEKKKMEHK